VKARGLTLLLGCLLLPAVGLAQQGPPIQQTPLPPLAAPGAPPATTPPATPPPTTTPAPAPMPPPANPWLPRQTAELTVLDKINGTLQTLAIAVGGSAQAGTLTIGVRACLIRPPDRAPDATAWLDIVDSTPNAPAFHGWTVVSVPSLSMLQHPVYDVRLMGCR
jgi:hypothetical protein